MTNLKTLDDYTKLPDGYTDYGTEKILETVCNETLESLANEMIKRRIIYEPKTYIFSTACNKNDFLSYFKLASLNDYIIDASNYGFVSYLNFGTYYKPLKRRLTHERRRSIKKFKLH